jgi:hypothetical protein
LAKEINEMGRELKRVPLDYEYEIGEVWKGFAPTLDDFQHMKEITKQVPEILQYDGIICKECDRIFNNCDEEARYCVWNNSELKKHWYYEPPVGEGFQIWSTTSEGHPMTPVFETLDELCEYAADNVSTFADYMATKDEWMKMLNDDIVYHKEGNIIWM